ncbi:nucleotide-diphospho-sugar transferase [Radiomyces spectabilis]|uniref:nucleotide-diphospho-sugar transferase n=1 Tax=Radiomyces spectabilis TaxID=64574 RepID=UPI00221F71C9|nr:nucleotide-diphospho-sugar transferase [Radiomyces spectabilis]KAI8370720.1 nucleotide-diphospho-sugar transferase [Radiomyces spectabilis]
MPYSENHEGRDNATSRLMSPTSKRNKRWFWQGKERQIVRTIVALTLSVIVIAVGSALLWSSSTNRYTIDPHDNDFIQYMCNQRDEILSAQKTKDQVIEQEKHDEISEWNRSPYLRTSNTLVNETLNETVWQGLPVKGAFYMMVFNQKLQEARETVRSIEDRFNHKMGYPWIFLNNQYFTPEFRKYIKKLTNAPVFFGKIDSDVYGYPNWIDIDRAERLTNVVSVEFEDVYKLRHLSYHQMLRYQAGLFARHSLFDNVDYVWRVEPGAYYPCDITFDPFRHMRDNKKKIGFVLTMKENFWSLPTFWEAIQIFMSQNRHLVLPSNQTIMPWILDEENEYNLCHFWSNFEIMDLSFIKSPSYRRFFEFLDGTGNFFYQRWGDAPVRTVAAALFLKREQIEFFDKIGYSHSVAQHCPFVPDDGQKCSCNVVEDHGFTDGSCTSNLLRLIEPNMLVEMIRVARSNSMATIVD